MNAPYWLAQLSRPRRRATVLWRIVISVVLIALLCVLRPPRCALCRVRCEQCSAARFGNVCSKCHDAVFRMYHYRAPRLTDEQARRILKNLWRDVEGYDFGGDGWKNG
jgi:hypothetical protein